MCLGNINDKKYWLTFSEQFNGQDNQAKDKNEQANTVNTVHITYPLAFRPA
jgi:hypothetical protein